MPWKFFTKPYFRINPAGKPEMPSWKIFISLLENYFFSVGKSNFRSRAILDDFFGSLLNYFKLFLFILKLYAVRQLKVKMFDSARWAMSLEIWVFSTKEQKDIFSLLNLLYNKRRQYRVDGHPELVSGSVRGEGQEKARGEMLN